MYDSYDGLYESLYYGLKEIDATLLCLAGDEDYDEHLSWLESSTSSTHSLLVQVKPSEEFSPKLDFKLLQIHLKYVHLEKVVNPNRKDWSYRLRDVLCA